MKTIIYLLIPVLLVTSCSLIKLKKIPYNDIEEFDGVSVCLLNDYSFKDLPNQNPFLHDRVLISDINFAGGYSYYIFWKDGRCFYSTGRDSNELSLESILNNKTGFAGYYKISNDTLWTEYYSNRTFLYNYYKLTENSLERIEKKGRKPYKKRMLPYDSSSSSRFKERYTNSQSDSIYFNNDSIVIWQPFW